jgi:hypothetical protein
MFARARADKAATLGEHRERQRGARVAIEADDVDFLVMAYAGVFDRAPDRDGLDDQLRALRSGESRERVLQAMVLSNEAATLALYRPGVRSLIDDFWRRRAQAPPEARPVCFLHTMKTAGTSLARTLVDLAGPWPYLTEVMLDHLVCMPDALLHQALLIAGHLPYEAVELLPDGVALCTVVRDPVERTLSHHAHLNAVLSARGRPPIALDEFVTSSDYTPLWRDYQARQLAHRIGVRDAWRRFSPVERAASHGLTGPDAGYPLQSLFDSTPLALDASELEELALERLQSIDLVGTTDHLDHLIGSVARLWGRPGALAVPHERVSDGRLDRARVRPGLIDAIVAGTAVDAVLYAHASRVAAEAA